VRDARQEGGVASPGERASSREEAIIREGDELIPEGAPPQSLLALLAVLEPIDEDISDVDDPPPSPVPL
jgi:hypothetical protein